MKEIYSELNQKFEYAVLQLDDSWLDSCNRYEAQSDQFPQEWSESQKYWFMRAMIEVAKSKLLERIENMRLGDIA